MEKLFIDCADPAVVAHYADMGVISGVTTNPSLLAKTGRPWRDVATEILRSIDGPVSLEVVSTSLEEMRREARMLSEIGSNVVVKVPLTSAGLAVCREMTASGVDVNVTLCFSVGQAVLAAMAGARYISPFIGRLSDYEDAYYASSILREIVATVPSVNANTGILAASIRSPDMVLDAIADGATYVTVPPSVIDQMIKHDLTDKGLTAFLSDWEKTGQQLFPAS